MMQLIIRGIVHGGYATAAEALDVAMRLELDDGDFEILEHNERLALNKLRRDNERDRLQDR